MRTAFRNIVKELIIGFGFLNGLWFAIGTSPEQEILGFLNGHVSVLPKAIQDLLPIIPVVLIILTIFTIIKIYQRGRILGILAILLSFIAGAIVLKNWKSTVVLLIASMILALIGFRRNGHQHGYSAK